MAAALGRFPIEAIQINRSSSLRRFALGQFARVRAARMIGGDEDIKVPRRGGGVRLPESRDDGLGVGLKPLGHAFF